MPLVARITALFRHTKKVIHGIHFDEYVAVLQHRHLLTGEIVVTNVTCEIPPFEKEKSTLSYRVGDYATAVYLCSNPEKSLKLYGFLGLRPDLGVITLKKSGKWDDLKLIGIISAVFLFFFAVAWDGYAFRRYSPIEFSPEFLIPITLGAMTLGVGLLIYFTLANRQTRNQLNENNPVAQIIGSVIKIPSQSRRRLYGLRLVKNAFLVFVGLAVGGGIMLGWAFTLNAICDSSQPTQRPIHICQMFMETHEFVFREYKIEYQFADEPAGEKHELLSTPWHMDSFGPTVTGFAHVRKGFFGWPWVETLIPKFPNPFPMPPAQLPNAGN